METQKHTPGPWEFINANVYSGVGTDAPKLIADVGATLKNAQEAYANGNLIAAAPDLLEACERALPILETLLLTENYADIPALMRDAIAKAKGGAS